MRAVLETRFAVKETPGQAVTAVQEKIAVLLDLRANLQRFITVLGAMVALAALAKGALRQAILATGGNPAPFPPEYVLLRARVFLYWACKAFLVYIPTYSLLAWVSDRILSIRPIRSRRPDLGLGPPVAMAGQPWQEP